MDDREQLARFILNGAEKILVDDRELARFILNGADKILTDDPEINSAASEEIREHKILLGACMATLEETAATKNNDVSVVPTDKVNKSLTKDNFNEAVKLSAKNNNVIVCNIDMLDENNLLLSEPLNYMQWTVLKAVYSLYESGNNYFTPAMVYRKMRGKTKTKTQLTAKAAEEIDTILWQLNNIRVSYEIVDGKNKPSKQALKWFGKISDEDTLLSFNSSTYILYGRIAKMYLLKARQQPEDGSTTYAPLLYEFMKRINHYELQSDKLYEIKKIDPNTGKEKNVQLDMKKCAIVNYLIDYITNFKHSHGNMSNRIDIEKMRRSCCIEIKHHQEERRNIDFIGYCMEHFMRNELIKSYKIKTDRNKKKFIEFFTKDVVQLEKLE